MESLHDHSIRSLTIDADARTLRLTTAWPQAEGPAFAEAVFEGVEDYVIVGNAFGTIIFAIEEVDAWSLYEEFGESMRGTYSQSGGHAPWVATAERARQFLSERAIKGYAVNSSIGFTGAVWARGYSARWVVPPAEEESSGM
jgi:hypothetical protein